jgi:hypothetical protein
MLKTKIKSKKKKLERLEIVINFVVVVMVIQFFEEHVLQLLPKIWENC